MNARLRPAPPLLLLLPALAALPVLVALPSLTHGGGWELIGQFLAAALRPSLDPLVLGSALSGLGVTVAIALVGWALSLALGLLGDCSAPAPSGRACRASAGRRH